MQWKTSTRGLIRSLYCPTEPLKLSGTSTSNLEATAFIKQLDTNDEVLKGLNNLFK